MVPFERFGKMFPKTGAKPKLEQHVSWTFNNAILSWQQYWLGAASSIDRVLIIEMIEISMLGEIQKVEI